MSNEYRAEQWRGLLGKYMYAIDIEREHILSWFGDDAISSRERSPKLHKLYEEADRIAGKIIDEERTEETKDILFWYYNT